MQLLDEKQIALKIRRLAVQILEHNLPTSVAEHTGLVLLGINRNGLRFAQLLQKALLEKAPYPVLIGNIKLSAFDPLSMPITCDLSPDFFNGRVVIMVDDVANTGRTLFYALQPLMLALPAKIEIAVLVDRKHKLFPVQPDYVGLSLATTLLQNISVQIAPAEHWQVELA